MLQVVSDFNLGPEDGYTVQRIIDSISKFDSNQSGVISIQGQWTYPIHIYDFH